MIKDKIRELAVKIICLGYGEVGSGVICKNNEKLYVITCKHVIGKSKKSNGPFELDEEMKIQYNLSDFIIIEKEKISCHNEFDIAIIEITDEQFIENYKNTDEIEFLPSSSLREDSKLIFCGFSVEHRNNEKFNDSKTDFELEYDRESDSNDKFLFKNTKNSYYGDDEYKGFSGSGIFHVLNGQLKLVGILTEGFGNDADYGKIYGTKIEYLSNIKINNSCIFKDEFNNQKDVHKYFLKTYLIDNPIYDCNKLLVFRQRFLEQHKFKYVKFFEEKFCINIEPCNASECVYKCNRYINNVIGVFILLYNFDPKIIENIDKGDEELFCSPKNIKNIRLICNDAICGKKLRISEFIRQIKSAEIKKETLNNNTLIIWSSNDDVILSKDKYYSSEKFKNMIADISETDYETSEYYSKNNNTPHDIAGAESCKDISIAHVRYFEEEAAECSEHNKKIDEHLKSVLGNILIN